MDNRQQMTIPLSSLPPCASAADDCYPMQLLLWLQDQADRTRMMNLPLEVQLEVV
ncbi:hypothetical protein [Oceanisphaera psychrotolerans]|uniref:hypothetical protein n=1 Tax=Oceanisphaera psychrotolerans TaxID=1414654 RepID=UPI001587786F|nr:hypothetical protein [Oceanisphaera psychrotolerans]